MRDWMLTRCLYQIENKDNRSKGKIGTKLWLGQETPTISEWNDIPKPVLSTFDSVQCEKIIVILQYILNDYVYAGSRMFGFHCKTHRKCNLPLKTLKIPKMLFFLQRSPQKRKYLSSKSIDYYHRYEKSIVVLENVIYYCRKQTILNHG